MKTRQELVAQICARQPSYGATDAGMLVDALSALGLVEVGGLEEVAAVHLAGFPFEVQNSTHISQGVYSPTERGALQIIERLRERGLKIVSA